LITITRRDALLLRRILWRPSLGLAEFGHAAPLVLQVDPEAGLRVRHHHGDLAVECLLPGSPRPAEAAVLPLDVLAKLAAAEDSPVAIRAASATETAVDWEVGGFPESRFPTVPPLDALPPHPAPPASWHEAPPRLLDDLAGHARSSPYGLLRLGGGRTAAVGEAPEWSSPLDGYAFPWEGDLLIRASPVFARRELRRSAALRLGRTITHLALRAGIWTLWMATRPEEDAVEEDD
jgi:hypothetical protein